jgi:NitT/TauT family transport system substrate-binding protein
MGILIFSACSTNEIEMTEPEIESIRLPMGYIPNIQYAPFYVAMENGYFEDAGFDVTFDYSFETDGIALVGAGELPFAVVSGEQVLLARAQEIPIVYVTAWFQDFPVAIITSEESGITSPAQLAGQQIALPGLFGANFIGLSALLQNQNINVGDVTLNAIGFNQVEVFAAGNEQIIIGYVNNEPIQLANLGYSVNVIAIKDYIELAANGIIANEDYISENPEKVERFVSAFLKGLQDVIDDPDATFQISTKYVEGLALENIEIQMEILETTIKYWEAERLGEISPQAWENMFQVLIEMNLVSTELDVKDAYTNQFIP